MAGRGLRSILQPILFFGIAAILHGMLFLIPGGTPGKRDSETTRGIRVKTYVEGRPAAPAEPRPTPRTPPAPDMSVPVATADARASLPGRNAMREGGPVGGGKAGDQGGPSGAPGPSGGPVVGEGGARPTTEFGKFVQELGSARVQGWARESAKASRQGWKGSGTGSGGWGTGSGAATGSGTGAGFGTGSGTGSGGGAVAYMDPRVRMLVIHYPVDENGNAVTEKARNIESRFRQVPYPDLKVKKSEYTSGWCNVYIEVFTTKDGKIERSNVLRPEKQGAMERTFIAQVKRELDRWTFEPGKAEIHVDVRFYVE